MHIIIVSPSLDPKKNVSGISSVTKFIIANNRDYEYIHFELGRKDNERGGVYRIGSVVRCYRQWKRLLRQYPDAIIHYNFPLEKPSILRDLPFMRAALKQKRKMVVHIHGGSILSSDSIPFPFKQILKQVFSWRVPFIALSDKEAETLRTKFHAKRVVSLPNCVDLTEARRFNRVYNSGSSVLTLGYLGRVAKTKGMDFLLQAFLKLKNSGVPFKLKMAGAEEVPGQYLPRFAEALGDDFEACGVIGGDDKTAFLKSLDVFVMPTFFEGLPMSLLECMSFGVVPVVTPVGSIPSVVTNMQNGLYVKVMDAETIVEAVTHLHNDRDCLEKMGTSARESIFRHFPTENYINTLNEIYLESVGAR